MSRWIDTFNNHAFQKQWKQIIDISQTLTVPDETVVTNVEELARLRKVISYIDELLKAADPELIPNSVWNSFNDQAVQCLDQINQFNANKNIGHLNNANANLDNLLTYIRPYVVSGKSAAQAATKAFITYSNTVDEQIKTLQSNAKAALNETIASKNKSDQIYKDMEASKKNIQQFENQVFKSSESEKGLKDALYALLEEAKGWHGKISEFHKRLTTGTEQESAIILQIEDAKKKAAADRNEVKTAKDTVGHLLAELGTFYVTIFGKEKEGGEREGGLKQEIETRLEALDTFKEEQNTAYKTLLQEIESLLPGATSAGLASAYHDLKKSFDDPIKHYSKMFYFSLIGIFIAACVLITHKVGFLYIEFVDINDPIKLFNNILYKLPILLPLLWLAIFSSKRRSEDRRLQQEYAHKEAVAKSYQSFKKQIEDLSAKDEEMLKQLLTTAINAIAFNASLTLDGKHGEKIPLQELLENLAANGNPFKKD